VTAGSSSSSDAIVAATPEKKREEEAGMAIPAAALELENQSIGASGKPTLGAAYELVRDQWRSGDRDRELGLHLMFLAWYVNLEPPHLTGLDESRVQPGELTAIFNEVHAAILPTGEDTDDAEAVFEIVAISAAPIEDARIQTRRKEVAVPIARRWRILKS
jgi:hypothetical protein